jgi:hypothetical protein
MLPSETLTLETTATIACHADLGSNSRRGSPLLAAFCLGIDLFEALPHLSNCSRDAHYLASHLQHAVPRVQSSVQNVVHCCANVTKLEFESAFSSFESELAEVSARFVEPELVILFLASHGFQLDSEIFVAVKDTHVGQPTQAELHHTTETCIDVTRLISRIKVGYSGPLALIIDACRTSPIPNLAFHLTSLANRINYPSNTLVCFSTSAGGVAADGGPLQHSPFIVALIQKLTVAELSIRSAIDAACNLLSSEQGSVCVTFQFRDMCLVSKIVELLVIGSPTGTELDVARQARLLTSAQERHSGHSGRIIAIGPRSIPAEISTLYTHAGIPQFDLPLSNNDIASILAIWEGHSTLT